LGSGFFYFTMGALPILSRRSCRHQSQGSEANTVVDNFNNLTQQQQQEMLAFLRSL
jgi:hypothetical protein